MRIANMPLSNFSFCTLVRGKRRNIPAIDTHLIIIEEFIIMAVSYSLLLNIYPETITLEQVYRIFLRNSHELDLAWSA